MRITIKTILVCMLLLLASGAHAQNPLTFGVKAGVNISDFSKDIEDSKMKAGFNAGITADYRLERNFYLLAGLEVTSKGTREESKYMHVDIGSSRPEKDKINWNPIYLNLPVHVGYKVYANEDMTVLFHVGPFLSYGIGGKVSVDELSDDVRNKTKHNAFGSDALLKRWDFGFGLGTGIEFRRMGINFGYDLGILNVSNEVDRSLKTNNAHVSLSYRFQ